MYELKCYQLPQKDLERCSRMIIITNMTRKPPSEGEIFVFTKMSFTNNNIGVDIITIGSLSTQSLFLYFQGH